jgi:ribosomal protein L12E/L44/L45/RPP1/RPP2
MKQNAEILNELKELSTVVADVPKVNVYSVSDNYFEQMHTEVMTTITSENKYAVPAGYFENLTASILQKVKANDVAEELQSISATVAAIGNKNVYEVPAKYFENLNYNTAKKQEAKVIPITKGLSKVVKLAAAAVVTGLLGFGIFTYVQKADITKEQTASLLKEANKIISTNSFEKDFATLTDADLEKYLEQSGENVEAAMVATTAEEAELPEVTDYYLDENTLNNFLEENNIKN